MRVSHKGRLGDVIFEGRKYLRVKFGDQEEIVSKEETTDPDDRFTWHEGDLEIISTPG